MIIRRFLTAVVSICAIVSAHAADQPANKANPTSQKILFLGNSITLHSPAPDIGWTGNWGMAASSEDKDYVHLVTAGLAKSFGSPPKTMVRNVAGFEREYATFEASTKLKEEAEFGAGIIIVAVGENVPELSSEDSKKAFAAAFQKFLATFKGPGKPAIFVRSCFWPSPVKDEIMRKESDAAGATFVDISELGKDASNQAKAERKIDHAGVAGHPGDKGMQAIADALVNAVTKQMAPK